MFATPTTTAPVGRSPSSRKASPSPNSCKQRTVGGRNDAGKQRRNGHDQVTLADELTFPLGPGRRRPGAKPLPHHPAKLGVHAERDELEPRPIQPDRDVHPAGEPAERNECVRPGIERPLPPIPVPRQTDEVRPFLISYQG